MVEVFVAKLGHDGQQRTFVVILQERAGERVLPIWIGRPEAESIAAHLHGVPRERPMTHDLVRSLIAALDGTVAHVAVTRVADHTYYAEMHVTRGGDTHVVDARPSDAIAIALRVGAPIFAEEALLEEYEEMSARDEGEGPEPVEQRSDAAIAESATYAENLRRHLEQMKPEDFGKFSL
ncbi:MAG TPA: bifunctional nuclease family protein [Gemmatimonadaceae bacterium]|nr:bifunctional nuclease family protein [Gemmatimonadaceae bacterium]